MTPIPRRFRWLVGLASVALAACGSTGARPHASPIWVRARMPVGLLALPDGGVLYGERLTGAIRGVGPDGTPARGIFGRVRVAGEATDQRGLLGLVRAPGGRVFVSWTRRSDARLVVGELRDDAEPRLVWIGPVSADRANGGSLAILPDGRLMIGIGDLRADRALADDPSVPNRKILTLDPDAPSTQRPLVLSSGWNNPYAIVVTTSGVPWVADNAGGRAAERIGRADRPAADATAFPRSKLPIAPAGLVDLGQSRLGVCGYVSGTLTEVGARSGAADPTGRLVARPCELGAAVRPDGRVVTATIDALHLSRHRVREPSRPG